MSVRRAPAWVFAAVLATLVPTLARAQDSGAAAASPPAAGSEAAGLSPPAEPGTEHAHPSQPLMTPAGGGMQMAGAPENMRDRPRESSRALLPPPTFRGPSIELFAARAVLPKELLDQTSFGGGGAVYVESMPWYWLGVQLGAAVWGVTADQAPPCPSGMMCAPAQGAYWWGLRLGVRLHWSYFLHWTGVDAWVDVHDSFGRSGDVTRHGVDLGVGAAFIVSDAFALGPFFRALFLTDPNGAQYSPLVLTLGLDVEIDPPKERYDETAVAETSTHGGRPHMHAHEFAHEEVDLAPRHPRVDHEPLVIDFETFAQHVWVDSGGWQAVGWGGGIAPQFEIALAKEFGLHLGGSFSLISPNATPTTPSPELVTVFASRVGIRFHWTALLGATFGDGWIDAHHEFVVSSGVARNGFDAGTGVDFNIGRLVAVGPFIRYVFADDPTNANANFIQFGLSVALMPQLRGGVEIEDQDHDGVPDESDLCPSVDGGAHMDRDNPGCPDRDADHDGLSDDHDECPSEPAGEHADRQHPGCPLPDRDHDGVPNQDDVCPDEPSGGNEDPLRDGCPLAH